MAHGCEKTPQLSDIDYLPPYLQIFATNYICAGYYCGGNNHTCKLFLDIAYIDNTNYKLQTANDNNG
jgi:hypothetical protein